MRAIAALMASSIAGVCIPASAQDAPFYQGKTITIVVGFTAGGGYDATARLYAQHMSRFIEGEPDVIVSNMPGAGSLVAAATLFNTAPRDGTTLGIIGGGGVLEAALGMTDAFDPRGFNWIGGRIAENGICMVADRTPVDTLEEVKSERVVLGATGPGSRTVSLPRLLNDLMGTRFEIIPGYPGSSEIAFAIENAEVDGQCGIAWGTVKARYGATLGESGMKALFQFGVERAGDLPDLPLASELAQSDTDRQAIGFLESEAVLAFPLLAPPGLPEERVGELRSAFEEMLADPQFLADAERLRMDVDLVSGEVLETMIAGLYATPEEIKQIVRDAISE